MGWLTKNNFAMTRARKVQAANNAAVSYGQAGHIEDRQTFQAELTELTGLHLEDQITQVSSSNQAAGKNTQQLTVIDHYGVRPIMLPLGSSTALWVPPKVSINNRQRLLA
ncbi:MAG: hypothetical protein MJY82_01790 [Fibrobacter sp.]|nr:hypothetical protein [Fibrobacter sp.]